ncbi:hypothetical protein KKI24_01015 [bacterium]|nr:hypothetical protein [bacterium]
MSRNMHKNVLFLLVLFVALFFGLTSNLAAQDSDSDGINDSIDKCDATANEEVVTSSGCTALQSKERALSLLLSLDLDEYGQKHSHNQKYHYKKGRKPKSQKDLSKKIQKAQKAIEKSLTYFEADNELSEAGKRSFIEDVKAVVSLKQVKDDVVPEIVASLVDADNLLASLGIATSLCDSREIKKAQREFAKAGRTNKPEKAIIHYKHAWQKMAACRPNDDDDPPVPNKFITGTAAVGAPIVGIVNVKGVNGNTASAPIDSNGKFELDVTALASPYILFARGTVNGESVELYSTGVADVINITPITNFILANALDGDPAVSYGTWNTASLTEVALTEATVEVRTQLDPFLTAIGIDSATDLISTPFDIGDDGLDALLEIVDIDFHGDPTTTTITSVITGNSITGSETFASDEVDLITNGIDALTAMNDFWLKVSALFATEQPTIDQLNDEIAPLIADDFLGSGRNKAAQLDRWASGVLTLGFTVQESIVRRMVPSEYGAYWDGYITRAVATSTNGTLVFDSAFVFDGVNWLWYGDQRIVTISAQFRASRISPGTGDVYQSFLRLRIEDLNLLAYNAGVLSAIVTGPGLPAQGLKFDRDYPRNRFCVYVSVSQCQDENYYFPTDDAITGIPENAEYTFRFYNIETADVSLGDTALATYKSIASGIPFLPSGLDATYFPSYNPEPVSHSPADFDVAAELVFNWLNVDPFIPDYFYVYWVDRYGSVYNAETAINDPVATSVTLDSSAGSTDDVIQAGIYFNGHDLSGRGLNYVWQFNRPPVNARFLAQRSVGSSYDNYRSILGLYIDGQNLPDVGAEIRSAIATGPGLPAEGVRFDRNFPRNDFCIINADSTCMGNWYEFADDAAVSGIPANTAYTFYLYDVAPADVSLNDTALATYTVTASGTPFVPSELNETYFPSFNPEPDSHLVTDVNFGGVLTYNWINSADFTPRFFYMNWNEDDNNYLNINKGIDDPSATSITVDTSSVYQGGTVKYASITIGGDDSAGRELHYTWEFSGPPVNAHFEAHRHRGDTYDNYSSFLSLSIEGIRLPDYGVELQSAIVTGPGLPGGGLVMKRTGDWFCIFDPVFGCRGMWEFTSDAEAGSIPVNSEYTFRLYDIAPTDVSLSDTAIATYTAVAGGTPFLPSALNATYFPSFNPEPDSHMIADFDIGGVLTYSWINIANFTVNDLNVGWNEDTGYFSVYTFISDPTATSASLDTSGTYQGGTLTNASINLSGHDSFGRRLSYFWEYSGPPVNAFFEAHRSSGPTYENYSSFLSLNIDGTRLPDVGSGIQSAIVTGPGLPDGKLVMKNNAGWFCIVDVNSACVGNMFQFTSDTEASSVPANPQYTFNFYDIAAADVSLGDTALATYTVVVPGAPFLPTELDSSDFPIFNPEPVSHLVADLDIGGVLTYNWINVAGFIPNSFNLGWMEGSSNFNVHAPIISPTATSVTLDTTAVYQGGTVTSAWLHFGGMDSSGRRLTYVWDFVGEANMGTWINTGELQQLMEIGVDCQGTETSPPIICDSSMAGREVYIADDATYHDIDGQGENGMGVAQGSSVNITGNQLTYSGSITCDWFATQAVMVTATRYQCEAMP